MTITPDGFRYRSQIFPTVNGLFRWFKDHYQEPVPGMETQYLLFIVYILPQLEYIVSYYLTFSPLSKASLPATAAEQGHLHP